MTAKLKDITDLLDELELNHHLKKKGDEEYIVLPFSTPMFRNVAGEAGVLLLLRLHDSGKVVSIEAPWVYRAEEKDIEVMRACMDISWKGHPYAYLLYDENDGEVRACMNILLGCDGKLAPEQLSEALKAMIGFIEFSYCEIQMAMGKVWPTVDAQKAMVVH